MKKTLFCRSICIFLYKIKLRECVMQGNSTGADFTKGLKPDFGLKFKTLVLNSGKNVLSQRA